VLFFFRHFSTSDGTDPDADSVRVSLSGSVVATNQQGKKRDLYDGDPLFATDLGLSVISGWAHIDEVWLRLWLDKNTDFAYLGKSGSWVNISLSQWRGWIESDTAVHLKMKHIELDLTPDDVILVEQQRIFSIVYVLTWDAQIRTSSWRETLLPSGKRIMVSQSNLVNPGTTLESLVEDIDDSMKQNPFFLARWGPALLEKDKDTSPSSSGKTLTGSLSYGKYLQVTSPSDGGVVTGSTVKVSGNILSPLVKKITINDASTTISASSFISLPLTITTDTLDIVYKGFDESNNLLERWVLTVYSQEKKLWVEKLVPTTFPTSDKDFRFSSPRENPYKTTASAVTVSGSVPKGAVEYITVNNFRLKKYVPYSGTWYYYANTGYQTMKEGFNLYEIKFYGQNSTLLSTQLFTIIKEGGTVSGE
jgi:hypothetical protein